jgi:hypothetical protein
MAVEEAPGTFFTGSIIKFSYIRHLQVFMYTAYTCIHYTQGKKRTDPMKEV